MCTEKHILLKKCFELRAKLLKEGWNINQDEDMADRTTIVRTTVNALI